MNKHHPFIKEGVICANLIGNKFSFSRFHDDFVRFNHESKTVVRIYVFAEYPTEKSPFFFSYVLGIDEYGFIIKTISVANHHVNFLS